MLQPLDGPAKQDTISVDTVTPVEIKVDSEAYPERKVITIQPEGKIRVFFADEETTVTQSMVANKGFKHGKNTIRSYEASCTQKVYILAETGSFDVIIAEMA